MSETLNFKLMRAYNREVGRQSQDLAAKLLTAALLADGAPVDDVPGTTADDRALNYLKSEGIDPSQIGL